MVNNREMRAGEIAEKVPRAIANVGCSGAGEWPASPSHTSAPLFSLRLCEEGSVGLLSELIFCYSIPGEQMDPTGSQLDSDFSQQDTPCLIIDDSQPESQVLEEDAGSHFSVLSRHLPNLQMHKENPVLVSE